MTLLLLAWGLAYQAGVEGHPRVDGAQARDYFYDIPVYPDNKCSTFGHTEQTVDAIQAGDPLILVCDESEVSPGPSPKLLLLHEGVSGDRDDLGVGSDKIRVPNLVRLDLPLSARCEGLGKEGQDHRPLHQNF